MLPRLAWGAAVEQELFYLRNLRIPVRGRLDALTCLKIPLIAFCIIFEVCRFAICAYTECSIADQHSLPHIRLFVFYCFPHDKIKTYRVILLIYYSMPALSIVQPVQPMADFRNYLEQSLRNPFVLDLKDCSLMEVIRICANAKSKIHPHYKESLGSLIYQ